MIVAPGAVPRATVTLSSFDALSTTTSSYARSGVASSIEPSRRGSSGALLYVTTTIAIRSIRCIVGGDSPSCSGRAPRLRRGAPPPRGALRLTPSVCAATAEHDGNRLGDGRGIGQQCPVVDVIQIVADVVVEGRGVPAVHLPHPGYSGLHPKAVLHVVGPAGNLGRERRTRADDAHL